jgi:hypothetical protein
MIPAPTLDYWRSFDVVRQELVLFGPAPFTIRTVQTIGGTILGEF